MLSSFFNTSFLKLSSLATLFIVNTLLAGNPINSEAKPLQVTSSISINHNSEKFQTIHFEDAVEFVFKTKIESFSKFRIHNYNLSTLIGYKYYKSRFIHTNTSINTPLKTLENSDSTEFINLI